jgi:hypothetical protein
MPHSILISRLSRHWDPFYRLFDKTLSDLGAMIFEGVDPATSFVPEDFRDCSYHTGRIAYFVEQLRSGRSVTPIEIDNHWERFTPCEPILLDGNHRLCAAILVGKRRIDCEYSGAVKTLRWLEGRGRANAPPFS